MEYLRALQPWQTGLVGLIALIITFQQFRISREQVKISRRQLEMVEDQKSQARAIATIALDSVLVPLMRLMDTQILLGMHRGERSGEFEWDPYVLRTVKESNIGDIDVDKLSGDAIAAFPNDAPRVHEALSAYRELKKVASQYDEAAWPQEDIRSRNSDAALNRFFTAMHMVGRLMPHAR